MKSRFCILLLLGSVFLFIAQPIYVSSTPPTRGQTYSNTCPGPAVNASQCVTNESTITDEYNFICAECEGWTTLHTETNLTDVSFYDTNLTQVVTPASLIDLASSTYLAVPFEIPMRNNLTNVDLIMNASSSATVTLGITHADWNGSTAAPNKTSILLYGTKTVTAQTNYQYTNTTFPHLTEEGTDNNTYFLVFSTTQPVSFVGGDNETSFKWSGANPTVKHNSSINYNLTITYPQVAITSQKVFGRSTSTTALFQINKDQCGLASVYLPQGRKVTQISVNIRVVTPSTVGYVRLAVYATQWDNSSQRLVPKGYLDGMSSSSFLGNLFGVSGALGAGYHTITLTNNSFYLPAATYNSTYFVRLCFSAGPGSHYIRWRIGNATVPSIPMSVKLWAEVSYSPVTLSGYYPALNVTWVAVDYYGNITDASPAVSSGDLSAPGEWSLYWEHFDCHGSDLTFAWLNWSIVSVFAGCGTRVFESTISVIAVADSPVQHVLNFTAEGFVGEGNLTIPLPSSWDYVYSISLDEYGLEHNYTDNSIFISPAQDGDWAIRAWAPNVVSEMSLGGTSRFNSAVPGDVVEILTRFNETVFGSVTVSVYDEAEVLFQAETDVSGDDECVTYFNTTDVEDGSYFVQAWWYVDDNHIGYATLTLPVNSLSVIELIQQFFEDSPLATILLFGVCFGVTAGMVVSLVAKKRREGGLEPMPDFPNFYTPRR